MIRIVTALLITVVTLAIPREASALIRGDVGNKPVPDPGWPAGASTIFNHPGRAAWWEGPPFGGGQWHAECRGDAEALNAVLAAFARMEVKTRRVVVHDGIGHSSWLAPNGEPEKAAAARVDWIFMVWQPANWEQLHKMPADFNPTEPGDTSPPSQVDVYTAHLDWGDVIVPGGIAVDDRRLSAHGFTIADGPVLEGKVTDLSSGRPLAAIVRLQRVEPRAKGGHLDPPVAESKADERGRWVLKNAPSGWLRVVVEAEGFVPRVAGYARLDEQPRWQSCDCTLSRSAPVTGRVVDEAGKPLPEVVVRLDHVQPASGGRYESPLASTCKTDADGRFRADHVPAGTATIRVHKPGYCRPGLGLPISTPKAGVELRMITSSSVRVTVAFTAKNRTLAYMVKIEPEGGEVVGSYGGSGNVDADGRVTFEDVPPGRYILRGRPNPGSMDEQAEPVAVELKGGEASEVTLQAR